MLRVGLTGGIASGKSTVADLLAQRGCHLLPMDPLAHEVMAPGQPAYREILEEFGRSILAPDGTIDRSRLGRIVFADPAKRDKLNRIVHPRVLDRTNRELARLAEADPQGIAVVEAALIVEAGYHRQLNKLVVTWCTPAQQIERLKEKTGLTKEEAEQRLRAQLPPAEKRRLADYVIDCSGSLEETERQVERVYRELRRLARGG